MDAIIEFQVNEETQLLAQQFLESQNRTLEDACREQVEQLAEQQRAKLSHDAWEAKQVDKAFEKIDSGSAVFIEHCAAMAMFEERKAKIRQG